MRKVPAGLVAAGLLLASTGTATAGFPGVAHATPPAAAVPQVRVMTQNLYLGANLKPLFTPGVDFNTAALAVLGAVQTADFPARAKGIAAEIKAQHPAVIGLQEVALWQTGTTCAALSASNPGGVDYLTTLLADLTAQGTPYGAVSIAPEFGMTAPVQGVGCASFQDRDVILARTDLAGLTVTNPQHVQFGSFATPGQPTELSVPITLPGLPTFFQPIHRGWASVDVTVMHKQFRFVDSHLEAFADQFRDAQASLLVEHAIEPSTLPVIAVGDFNSRPTDTSGAYGTLTAALTDAWPLAARAGDPGYTSGQDDSLRNIPSKIDHRIDLILFQAGPLHPDPQTGVVVGNSVTDMVPASAGDPLPGPIWPSDHAGVVASLHAGRPPARPGN